MKHKNFWELIFVAFSVFILIFMLVGSAMQESPTYDEVTYAEAGYQFLINKDFRFDPFSPPLAKEIIALPALVQKNVIYSPTIFWPRMMVVLFTVLLAILVYVFSKKMFGSMASNLALILFIFEPNILANGHYATADLIFTFFLTLSLFLFWIWKNKITYGRAIFLAVVMGLLLSTKLTSIPFFVFPIAAIYVFDKNNRLNLLTFYFWRKRIWIFLMFVFITLLTLWSTYFFKLEPPLGYRFDRNRPAIALAKNNPLIRFALTTPIPLGSYISTIKQIALFNYSDLYVKRSFFGGKIWIYGSPGYYFPILFVIKTPLPLLIIFLLSLTFFFKNLRKNKYLLVPIFFTIFNVLFSNVTLVNRYILPIYPLIIIYSSQLINTKIIRKKLVYISLAIMMAWYIAGTIRAYPYFISYMNETIGGMKNGYRYLVDANYDWGQGLIALKEYQDKNKIKNLQFAYFGSVDPARYGIKYEKIKNLSIIDNKKIESLKFDKNRTVAISATCWYFCGYYKNQELSNLKPIDVVGGSILIFKK